MKKTFSNIIPKPGTTKGKWAFLENISEDEELLEPDSGVFSRSALAAPQTVPGHPAVHTTGQVHSFPRVRVCTNSSAETNSRRF